MALPIDRERFLAAMNEAWDSQLGVLREFTDKMADAVFGKTAAGTAGTNSKSGR